MRNIPVLIVGAGPVGLSMALALARQNVRSLVIEQMPGRTQHPRARGVSMRTMELFNQWGNINELLKFEFPKEAIRFIWARSLQGKELTRIEIKDLPEYSYGPVSASFVTQDCVEVYLQETLRNHQEVEVEFSKEILSFEEDANGVLVYLLNRQTHKEECIRATYLIAADGAHSRIRKHLGIDMLGPENLGRFCNVYCEFDIAKWTQHRPSIGYFFTDPNLLNRNLFTAYGKNRWIVGMRFSAENTKEDFTDSYCLNEIRRVLDLPDLSIKILNKSFWTMAAQVAKQYRKGSIFLVGDAAHRLPPTGGLGMNTGIQDAHNLAWKLAWVLNHHVSDTLLNTYYDERAPIAKRNIEWSMQNAKRFVEIAQAIKSGDDEQLAIKLKEQQQNLNYEGLDLGFIYHSDAVMSENEQTLSELPAKYVPTTLPGSRAPYVRLMQDNQRVSTLDFFEKELVLFVGSHGQLWQEAALKLAQELPFPLKSYRIAEDGDLLDIENTWYKNYEITDTGAVLIRPDGHVFWRAKTMTHDPQKLLKDICRKFI